MAARRRVAVTPEGCCEISHCGHRISRSANACPWATLVSPAILRRSLSTSQYHNSWNGPRSRIFGLSATGEYEDFLTGFVVDAKSVWGRPVGVGVLNDGSLLVSDDGSGSIWRVSYGK